MIFIRSIRNICDEYKKNYRSIPETEENFSGSKHLEISPIINPKIISSSDNWPEIIALQAEMIPTEIDSDSIFQRINGDLIGKPTHIYSYPVFAGLSFIKFPNVFCKSLQVKFNNIGEYVYKGEHFKIFSKNFDDYKIEINNDNVIFEKKFQIQKSGLQIEKYRSTATRRSELVSDIPNIVKHVFPYAGFFSFGCHPQNVEACVFQVEIESLATVLKVSPLSAWKSQRMSPLETCVLEGGGILLSSCDFSESEKLNLYEEIQQGALNVEISNSKNHKKKFASYACSHIHNTNLINVFFK